MPPSGHNKNFISLLAFLALCYAVALSGALITRPNIPVWYMALHKPFWAPPNWLFGPVWTVLYAMMAVAGWKIWSREPSRERTRALTLFGVQLALNFSWSPVFFGLHELGGAVLVIFLLWLAIGGFLLAVRRAEPLAAALFLPYFLWVGYAGVLNFAIWRLN